MTINRLKQCRTARHMSMRELADAAGLHEDTVKNIERGHMPRNVEIMQKLAHGLEMPVNAVFPMR